MKNGAIISLLASLSCTAPERSTHIPTVEMSGKPIIIVEKEIERIPQPAKEPPAKKAAAFIAQTLEKKLQEFPKAQYLLGHIYFKDSVYHIDYMFDPSNLCSVDDLVKPLFKGSLEITFNENQGSLTSSYDITEIGLGGYGRPFYPLNHLSFIRFGTNSPPVLQNYPAFKEAKDLYEALLLYTAQELALNKIETIDDYTDSINIEHLPKEAGAEEEKMFQDYRLFREALQKQQPSQEKITFVQACNP